MRFNAFAIFAAAASLAFVSCAKNTAGKLDDEKIGEETTEKIAEETMEPPAPIETFAEGTILSKSASLCLFGRDSAMHPVIKLSQGASVTLLEVDGEFDSKTVPDSSKAAETENAETISEGTKYIHAVHDSMDFWIEASTFAIGCVKAAAIERTSLFADSELTQKLDASPLKFSSVVAKAKIFFYDSEAKAVKEAFVPSSSISERKDDIEVSRIAEALKTTTRAAPRNALFAEAARYKPSAKVLSVLNAQKEERQTYSYQEAAKAVQKLSRGVNVDELMTVDQSKDPFK